MKKLLTAAALAALTTTAWVLACGPYTTEMRTIQVSSPAHPESYARGSVGIVRPRFGRRYLVQAYRRFLELPPLPNAVPPARPSPYLAPPAASSGEEWLGFRRSVETATPGSHPETLMSVQTDRSIGNYQFIRNCLDDAFAAAVRTGQARSQRYGAGSAQLREWVRAQDAVFANCAGETLVLPDAPSAAADPLIVADRAYQTAAAYFYAMKFDEAAERFRAIAADASSPWRPYGHYLAARALIRQGTIPEKRVTASLTRAEEELRQVLDDSSASALHGSARGLQDFVVSHVRPAERVRALGRTLAESRSVTDQQLDDYEWLMNHVDDELFDYASAEARDAIVRSADLNDWMAAMQDGGDRALAGWKQGSTAWLVAALWHVPPTHDEAPALLTAAANVPRSSQAYATITFLRARLLAARGDRRQARAILSALPRSPREGYDPESLNLFAAERMMLAANMQELLANAPRRIVAEVLDDYATPSSKTTPVFDADSRVVFSQRLPLARLVEAATAGTLPARLKLHVASAAFTRAVLLKRDDEALKLVPVLSALAPALRADLARFERAGSADDRHRAGVLLLLRTPGLHASVPGPEDDRDLAAKQPPRVFDHTFRNNWWCSFAAKGAERVVPESELLSIVYATGKVPAPAFLSARERAQADAELQALGAIGVAPNYLAAEAVSWAIARPTDQDAAEALARAVLRRTHVGRVAPRVPDAASAVSVHRVGEENEVLVLRKDTKERGTQ